MRLVCLLAVLVFIPASTTLAGRRPSAVPATVLGGVSAPTRSGAVPGPEASPAVFRASGGGYTLYGVMGPPGKSHAALLRRAAEAPTR